MHPKRIVVLMSAAAAGLLALPALAQDAERGPSASSMRMTYAPQETRREAQEERQEARPEARPEEQETREAPREEPEAREMADTRPRGPSGAYEYRGVSSFFNIREANSNVEQGEWEFEFTTGWGTGSDGSDDDVFMTQSLKYGVTNEFHIELEVAQPTLGDSDNTGAGEMELTLFYQFVKETDAIPAIAGVASMRIPTGDGSSGVDARFSGIITKSVATRCRAHLQGYVETVNGSTGASDAWLRSFRWGVGPGFDYQIDDNNLVALNYLHQVDEEVGVHNENVLQIATAHKLGQLMGNASHGLKFAFDVGLDGSIGTPNFAAKMQWGIEIK